MTDWVQDGLASIRVVWSAAVTVNVALAAIAFIAPGSDLYRWALAAAILAGGGVIARHDVQTLTIPNRFVLPLFIAAAVQAVVAAIVEHRPAAVAVAALAGGVAFSVYVVLGLAGWVGFGDAKLAAALGMAASITTGTAALLIVPGALLLGGLSRLLHGFLHDFARTRSHRQPHAPALVGAAACLLVFATALLPM